MELSLSREDAAFRDEVRTFIAENYPQEMRVANPETDLTKEQMLLWHRILYRQGWIAPLWPKEYGGPAGRSRNVLSSNRRLRAPGRCRRLRSASPCGAVIYTFAVTRRRSGSAANSVW